MNGKREIEPGSRGDVQRAVALRWDPDAGAGAPQVVASGRGAIAERIAAVARAHGVPVREDADLVTLLAACGLGEEIPPELYAAVAEVLSWVLRRDAELAGARE
jgi:flagellar biosynthesis protein